MSKFSYSQNDTVKNDEKINEKISQFLLNKFDKISILTLSSRHDRRTGIVKMLGNIGIKETDVDMHVSTIFPYNKLIIDAFNKSFYPKRCFTKANEFDCARNHYGIVKQALDEGKEHILIIEDDIRIFHYKDLLYSYLEAIPEDYDVLQFGGFTTDPRAGEILEGYNKGVRWVKHPDVLLWNASMYALSRKGMQYYIAYMDQFFTVADMPLYIAPKNDKIINTYAPTIPLVIQADKELVVSDIRSKENDPINYKTMNVYESGWSENDYFIY